MTGSGFSSKPRRGSDLSGPDDGGFETMRRSSAHDSGTEPSRPSLGSDLDIATLTLSKPKPRGPSLKARAVGYLSRREHARQELARKLQPYAESPAEIESLLDALEKEGWLSTERFAQSLVHRKAARQGTARIVQELRQHGVAEEQVAQLREDLRATEYSRAQEVWRKRFGDKPADRTAYAKQARFLAGRGFSHDAIRRVLGGSDEDD